MHPRIRALMVSTLLALSAGSLGAQNIVGRATGLLNPTITIDFEFLPPIGSQVGIVNTVDLGGLWIGGPGAGGSSFGTNGAYSFNTNTNACCVNPFTLLFYGISSVAFNFVSNPGTSTFTAFLGANAVSTFTTSTDNNATTNVLWYGFENLAFDRIEVLAPGNGAMGFDNIQYAEVVVPEPATLSLIAGGLVLLLTGARTGRRS